MTLRLALAQLNSTVGAIDANAEKVLAMWRQAEAMAADLVVFPELALTGYPPGDLILEPEVIVANRKALRVIAEQGPRSTTAVVGFVDEVESTGSDGQWDVSIPARSDLRNAAAVLRDGEVAGISHKGRLPTYGVFDEARWFVPGRQPLVVDVAGTKVGVTICEDLWSERGPVSQAAAAGATVIVNINASPYHRGKRAQRGQWVSHHAAAHNAWLAYANAVGGQDGIVFDGDSLVATPDGRIVASGPQFEEDLVVIDLRAEAQPAPSPPLGEMAEVWAALVLGTRDFCRKNGIERVLLGLSGGIDSSLAAAVAVDALGPTNVLGVLMPSPYTSAASNEDAVALADNLGFRTLRIPIAPLMEGFDRALEEGFGGLAPDVTEENLQARIRGVLLMALANKLGCLLLATGNKSESAVGYTTLYGDMAGGFAPMLDVNKELVYALARLRNARGPAIPTRVMERAPTAELSPGQRDEDSLPPYPVLDDIISHYVEHGHGVRQIAAAGHDEALVRETLRMIDAAEFKRHQAAPFVRITQRSFTKDRRMPVTNAWRH